MLQNRTIRAENSQSDTVLWYYSLRDAAVGFGPFRLGRQDWAPKFWIIKWNLALWYCLPATMTTSCSLSTSSWVALISWRFPGVILATETGSNSLNSKEFNRWCAGWVNFNPKAINKPMLPLEELWTLLQQSSYRSICASLPKATSDHKGSPMGQIALADLTISDLLSWYK